MELKDIDVDKSDAIENHFGKGDIINLDGKNIKLRCLGMDYIPQIWSLYKLFSRLGKNNKDVDSSMFFDNVTDKEINYVRELISETLNKSCIDESNEWKDRIGLKYSFPLIAKIIEINSPTDLATDDEIRKRDRVRRLNEKLQSNQ